MIVLRAQLLILCVLAVAVLAHAELEAEKLWHVIKPRVEEWCSPLVETTREKEQILWNYIHQQVETLKKQEMAMADMRRQLDNLRVEMLQTCRPQASTRVMNGAGEIYQTKKPAPVPMKICDIGRVCDQDTIPYKVRSGTGFQWTAVICINGIDVLRQQAIGRGLIVALLNAQTLQMEKLQRFDTYADDAELFIFLKLEATAEHIVVITSHDEASLKLTDKTRSLISSFGSQMIKKIAFRDTFVMIGQRGLEEGQALEKLEPISSISYNATHGFAAMSEISGCLRLPLGN